MSYEQVWVLIGVLAVAFWGALAIWSRHLREAKRLKVRDMIHRERMAALEQGKDLSELPGDIVEIPHEEPGQDAAVWVHRAALAAGLALVFVGIGTVLGFHLMPETKELADIHAMAPIGLLPVFGGVGLLVFWWVDRRQKRAAEGV